MVSTSGAPGGTIFISVELDSLGNEVASQFTLNFDPTLLNISNMSSPDINPDVSIGTGFPGGSSMIVNGSQAPFGRIGVLVDSPTPVAAGTRSHVIFRFQISQSAGPGVTMFAFGDNPTPRSVSDEFGSPLAANYIHGSLSIQMEVEADVSPRAMVDGIVMSTDVTQIRRFVTGLDSVSAGSSEGQRADCSPRSSRGDGILSSSDVVQARRYAAGLDPATEVGGPSLSMLNGLTSFGSGSEHAPREIRFGSPESESNGTVLLPIEFGAFGDEMGLGFTVDFDTSILSNPTIVLASDIPLDATLTVNTDRKGQIAILLDSTTPFVASGVPKSILFVRFELVKQAAGLDAKLPVWISGSLTPLSAANESGESLPVFIGSEVRGTELHR